MTAHRPPVGLPERLKHARLLDGIAAHELSLMVSTSPSVVSMIEREDTRDPRGGVLGRLAKVLGISLDWLVNGDGPEPAADDVRAAVAAARAARDAATGAAA